MHSSSSCSCLDDHRDEDGAPGFVLVKKYARLSPPAMRTVPLRYGRFGGIL